MIVMLILSWLYFMGAKGLDNHITFGSCTFIVNPECPDPAINFYLYTRANVNKPQLVTAKNITESYFVKTRSNKFILHGFNADFESDALQSIKNEYLKLQDFNVWMIDYSGISNGPELCYIVAVYNLPSVGTCAAIFVRKIMELSELEDPREAMHLIGFSLGGQLAGQIAENLKPIKLPRITGLDPALPLFYTSSMNRRLSKNDADYVDVMHTNAMIQGQLDPCGHIDFYVNGGITQPACNNSTKPIGCDHNMAPVYFAESIGSSVGFWAWPCSKVLEYLSGKCPQHGDHQIMGEHVNKSATGQYVLQTNIVQPYAQGNWKPW